MENNIKDYNENFNNVKNMFKFFNDNVYFNYVNKGNEPPKNNNFLLLQNEENHIKDFVTKYQTYFRDGNYEYNFL